MRLILLIFVVFSLASCSHSPPIYTPSRMLIDGQDPTSPNVKVVDNINVNDNYVSVNGKRFDIIERYTSALNRSCVRYIRNEGDNNSRNLDTFGTLCKDKGQQWQTIVSLD